MTHVKVASLGAYGLPAVLPIVFYAGVGLLLISATAELLRKRVCRWRMAAHSMALVFMLYGTAPIVYGEGRYPWLYKTIGVVQYVNYNGHLDSHIDIYQNWPGFFAFAAWFDKVAGVGSPLAYAKWAQLVFELGALPLLYLIYERLALSVRQRWAALLVFSASNWIGQDYFSPQALGMLLSLGILAIAVRWLYNEGVSRSGRRGRAPYLIGDQESTLESAHLTVSICVVIALLFFVLTFTHELSPYILVIQLGALAAAKLLRPRWLPVLLAAIAFAYLIPRFPFVNSRYGLLNSIGSFFSNATPPAFKRGTVPGSQLLIEHCAELLSLGMWGLAILGAWMRRRAGYPILGLVLLTFSPFILLAAQAYGNEGILRIYLFSLPSAAALAAHVVVPSSRKLSKHRSDWRFTGRDLAYSNGQEYSFGWRRAVDILRLPIVLSVTLMLFFPSFFGDDKSNVIPTSEVLALTSFFQHASRGPVYVALDHGAFADTARYDQFPLTPIFGSASVIGQGNVKADIADLIARDALARMKGTRHAYVVLAPSMIAYNQAYDVASSKNFAVLAASLTHSTEWKLVVSRQATLVYELDVPSLPRTRSNSS